MTAAAKFGLSGLILGGALTVHGCVLLGVEPEEIDVADADGETGDSNGDGDGDTANTSEGDGDGDPGDGDGDGDATGDGDGDPTTGDGDGDDSGDGDGDGDGDVPCAELDAQPLVEGGNDVILANVMSSFEGSCGAAGPDALFSFTAELDGTYSFTLSSLEFEGVIYLAGPSCQPLEELDCQQEDVEILYPMMAGEVVYVIVDSSLDPGAGNVTITAL